MFQLTAAVLSVKCVERCENGNLFDCIHNSVQLKKIYVKSFEFYFKVEFI